MKKRYKDKEKAHEIARKVAARHMKAFEAWPHGDIKEVWPERKNIMCIMYESGTWFHYDLINGGWW